MLVEIRVNGEMKQVPDGLTLRTLLEHLGVDGARVAVEYNRGIVRSGQWATTPVEAGCEIEIVEFVGGGAA